MKPIMYEIYKIVNKINGKIYIGMSRYGGLDRFNKHIYLSGYTGKRKGRCRYLENAIRKYGANNFCVEIICKCGSQQEMEEKEYFYIKQYKSYLPDIGYNIIVENPTSSKRCREFISQKASDSMTVKSHNKAKRKNGINGIGFRRNFWFARVCYKNVEYSISSSSKETAIENRDKICLYLFGKDCAINNENKREQYLKEDLESFFKKIAEKKEKRKLKNRGVYFSKENKKYAADISISGKRFHLGYYDDAEKAAEIYDRISFHVFGNLEKLNYPEKVDFYRNTREETLEKFNHYCSLRLASKIEPVKFHGVECSSDGKWGFQFKLNCDLFASNEFFDSRERCAMERDVLLWEKSKLKVNKLNKFNFPMASLFRHILSNDGAFNCN